MMVIHEMADKLSVILDQTKVWVSLLLKHKHSKLSLPPGTCRDSPFPMKMEELIGSQAACFNFHKALCCNPALCVTVLKTQV